MMLLSCARTVALWFALSATFISSGTVTVKEINADPGCSGRATAIYSTITEDSCTGGVTCTAESGWTDITSSEYKFCNYDRAGYLRYAFPNVQYLLFDYYEDSECKTLMQSSVVLADGKCHSSVHYTLMFETDGNDTVYILSRGIDCNRGAWSNFTEPIPKTMINTGKCFVGEHTNAKVYLINGSATSTTSTEGSTSGTTSTTNGTVTGSSTTSSSTALIAQTPLSMLVFVIASILTEI